MQGNNKAKGRVGDHPEDQGRTKVQPQNPIEHVVIIVKENHGFDNYFGTFPRANGASLPPGEGSPSGR